MNHLLRGGLVVWLVVGLAKAAFGAGFTDAAAFGFSPEASGVANTHALQQAVDRAGTIVVRQPGVYPIAGTVFVGGNTTLVFSNGVVLKKVAEEGPFTHVLLNKGALTRTYDEHITIDGLRIQVNGVDVRRFLVYGLHGQVAFFYVKDLRIEHFRCEDLGRLQYAIHVCRFEDLLVDDVVIKGKKDGVHLGCGRHFVIRNGEFETGDDAVALNAHDYSTGNPELGWIEDGLVENCRDLNDPVAHTGYFCRILAGAWKDWAPGMRVQQSDTVVSGGRLYRVQMQPDGKSYPSVTRPTHVSGSAVVDGITWGVVQSNVTYTAGVRNVTFRHIVLENPRTSFSVHFDNDRFSRSYYPGAEVPRQGGLVFADIQVRHRGTLPMFNVATPVDDLQVTGSSIGDGGFRFVNNRAMHDYGPTAIELADCTFRHAGEQVLVRNEIPGKRITLKTSGSHVTAATFSATVTAGGGNITVDSDLPGLK